MMTPNPKSWHEAIDEIYRLKGIPMITQEEYLDRTQTPKQIDQALLRMLRLINGILTLGVITWAVWSVKTIIGWFI